MTDQDTKAGRGQQLLYCVELARLRGDGRWTVGERIVVFRRVGFPLPPLILNPIQMRPNLLRREHISDPRHKSRQYVGECRLLFSGKSEIEQFLANQIVERCL